jgi:hypothetical protein
MKRYRNKNLIYVGGQGYHEQDLLDMIDYYQQTYQPNVTLPTHWNEDLSSQIFKHYSFYPQISKSTYRPNLYYEQYCHLDITFKEFLNYIDEKQPNEYAFLIINNYKDVSIEAIVVNVVRYNEDDNYTLYSYHIDSDEQMVDIGDEYNSTPKKMLKFIINNYSDHQIIWYDLSTVARIYNKRQRCQAYNNQYYHIMYKQYYTKFISSVPKIIDIDTFIMYYTYYLFILHNVMIIESNTDMQKTIADFVRLLDQGIPQNVDELNQLMEPYNDIKTIINV